jgi:hypothetical protein
MNAIQRFMIELQKGHDGGQMDSRSVGRSLMPGA